MPTSPWPSRHYRMCAWQPYSLTEWRRISQQNDSLSDWTLLRLKIELRCWVVKRGWGCELIKLACPCSSAPLLVTIPVGNCDIVLFRSSFLLKAPASGSWSVNEVCGIHGDPCVRVVEPSEQRRLIVIHIPSTNGLNGSDEGEVTRRATRKHC